MYRQNIILERIKHVSSYHGKRGFQSNTALPIVLKMSKISRKKNDEQSQHSQSNQPKDPTNPMMLVVHRDIGKH